MKPHDEWNSADIADHARRAELYKERAEWANLESDISESRKYFPVGGFFWKLFGWFDRKAKQGRREVQEEIDDMQDHARAIEEGKE